MFVGNLVVCMLMFQFVLHSPSIRQTNDCILWGVMRCVNVVVPHSLMSSFFPLFFYFILLSEHIEQKINVKPFLMLAFVLACLLAFILIVLFVLVKLRNRYKTKSKNDQICRVFGCWCAFGNKFRYIHFCFHSFPYGLDFQQTKVESHVLCLTRVRWPPILTYHRQ